MKSSSSCIIIAEKISLLYLILPFGMNPATAQYATISEAEMDPSNALIQYPSWDPKYLHYLNIEILPTEEILGDDIPLEKY